MTGKSVNWFNYNEIYKYNSTPFGIYFTAIFNCMQK